MKVLKMSVITSSAGSGGGGGDVVVVGGSSSNSKATSGLSTGRLTRRTASGLNVNVNVNVNAATTSTTIGNLLAVESACTTPRTPEILNSLIAMTNPMDDYAYAPPDKSGSMSGSGVDSNSNSSGSPLGSPANSTIPSIQKTCSQLIKASLKSSIESKRKLSGSDSTDGGSLTTCHKRFKKEEASDDEYDDSYSGGRSEGLTPEDEERRRRRRERNKIAATKCRLKKRERTVNLVSESEILETQNIDLKTQIQALEVQRQQLVNMLSHHSSTCIKNNANAANSPTATSAAYNPIQPPYDSPTSYPSSATPYEPNSPYIRPESANVLASSYTTTACDLKNTTTTDFRQMDISYGTPPSEGYITPGDQGFTKAGLLGDVSNYDQMQQQQQQQQHHQQYDGQDGSEYHHQFGGEDVNPGSVQQCHNAQLGQNKFRNGMDMDSCMA